MVSKYRETTIVIISFFVAVIISIFLPEQALAQAATLSFSPASKNVTTGDTLSVDILLNTGGVETAGADIEFTFDKSKLVLLDIRQGTIYEQYLGKTINNGTGRGELSGLVGLTSSLFSGSGVFATADFQAISAGTAAVTFDFTSGNTTDTNVVDFNTQTDALGSVTNGSYTVSGATITTTTTTTTSSQPASATTQTKPGTTSPKGGVPVTSSSSPTVLLSIIGIILMWLSNFFFKFFG